VEDILQTELSKLGLSHATQVAYGLNRAELIETAINNHEGKFSQAGALVVDTSPYTGRSPNDKYIVENGDPDLWFASGTQAMDRNTYTVLKHKVMAHLERMPLYVRDMRVGADAQLSLKVRIISDLAWHNLTAANMFIPLEERTPVIDPDFTVIVATSFAADPKVDGVRSPAFIILNFEEKLVLIGTTHYAGEIRNLYLPT